MKLLKIFLIVLLSTTAGYGQFNMPTFEDVVTQFFSTYNFNSHDSYVKFQRKKEGWYVAEDRFSNPGHYFNTQLLWEKASNTYRILDYPGINGDSTMVPVRLNDYQSQIDWQHERYQFERNRYYGYPGWDWDMISDTTGETNLSDSLLESLARAYFNYASGFIADQYGDLLVNNDSDRIRQAASVPISKARIEKFIFYELKAIDAYTRIVKMNPHYQTKVGNIKIKLANEYLFSYLELMMAGDSTRARAFAEKADYPDSLLNIGKAYLSDLPVNSILITFGDNDTYPLWYLQQVRKFRPDVAVHNYNLIGFRRYLSLMNQDKRQGRLFSTSDTSYLKNNFDHFIYSNPKAEDIALSVETFLDHLTKNYNPYDTVAIMYKGEVLKKYYTKKLFFENANKSQTATIELGDYLFMNDYILLDIIYSTSNRRIFFTYNPGLLSALLTQEGYVYELKKL